MRVDPVDMGKGLMICRRYYSSRLYFLAFFLLVLSFLSAFSQQAEPFNIDKVKGILLNRGELVVQFKKPDDLSMEKLTCLLSIDKYKNDTITAYVSRFEWAAFLQLNIEYAVIDPSNNPAILKSTQGSLWSWNKYPTYPEYLTMMDSLGRAYPKFCKILTVGKSATGKSIIFARINSDTLKAKPSVMYSSTIHGDETGGFVMMLRLVEYLLKNYSTNPLATQLLDSLDIWINPLANPDGTYISGDTILYPVRLMETVWI
jgi:hypothetical protein